MGKFPVYESSKVPDVGRAPSINASAFGAPGRAIAKLGGDLASFEAHAKTRADQTAMFKAQTDLNNADAEAYKQLQENIQDANDGSEIFNRTITPYDGAVKGITEKLPEHLRPRFGSIASRSRESLSNRSVSAQVQAQRRFFVTGVEKSSLQAQRIVGANPDAFSDEFKKMEDYIDNSGVDGATKEKMRQKHMSKLEEAHVTGRFNRGDDVNAVVKDINRKKDDTARNTSVRINSIVKRNPLKLQLRKGPIQGVVIHHTGGRGKVGAYETSVKNKNGAHYYIDRDGSIDLWTPEDRKIGHIRNPGHKYRTDGEKYAHLSNDSTLGIEVVAKDSKDFTPAQKEALDGLLYQLAKKHGIPRDNVVGHGEIQGTASNGNRRPTEGTEFALRHRNRRDHADGLGDHAGHSHRMAPIDFSKPKDQRKTGFKYNYLTQDQVKRLSRKGRTVQTGQKFDVQQQMKDDIASIRETGKAGEVDMGQAQRVLKPDQISKYNHERNQAITEFRANEGLHEMTDAAMSKRLNSLRPTAGQKGYEFRSDLYAKTQKKIEQIQKDRVRDPAKAVGEFETVKEAKTKLDPAKPETYQNLVKQRYIAQMELDLPEGAWSGITRQEARSIVGPILNVTPEQLPDAIEKVAAEAKKRYGKYSERVLQDAIRFTVKKEADRALATQTVKEMSEAGEAEQAVTATDTMSVKERLQEEVAGDLREETGAAVQKPKPNKQQIQLLRDNPDKYQEFGLKFGFDAAAKILGKDF